MRQASSAYVPPFVGRQGDQALLIFALTVCLSFSCDDAGERVVHDVAQAAFRLDAGNVRRITWPNGCIDACDVLTGHGRDVLATLVGRAVRGRTDV